MSLRKLTIPFALLINGSAASAQSAQAVPDELVEAYTMKVVELWTRLDQRFLKDGAGQAFFRAAGPFKGCDAYKQARRSVAEKHYPRFRSAMIAVYREIVPNERLRQGPVNRISPQLAGLTSSLSTALDSRTEGIVATAHEELVARLKKWQVQAGLSGSALGVNSRGEIFWVKNNPATISLVCAMPDESSRRNAVLGWVKE